MLELTTPNTGLTGRARAPPLQGRAKKKTAFWPQSEDQPADGPETSEPRVRIQPVTGGSPSAILENFQCLMFK